MHDTSTDDRARPDRRRVALAAIVAAVAVVATLAACSDGGGGEKADAGRSSPSAHAAPTSPEAGPATTGPPATTPPTTDAPAPTPAPAPAPAPATPVAATTPPAPAPEPILRDGRHPVYLTEIDVAGSTVEFDLLQYLVGDDAEAYEDAHPDEYGEGDDYDESPFHNDNPRLRRLPVAAGARVFVQGRTYGCDGPHATTLAALPGYLGRNTAPGSDHLGYQAFWLTAQDGIVVDLEETRCAG
jgi:hypothetical protein